MEGGWMDDRVLSLVEEGVEQIESNIHIR